MCVITTNRDPEEEAYRNVCPMDHFAKGGWTLGKVLPGGPIPYVFCPELLS